MTTVETTTRLKQIARIVRWLPLSLCALWALPAVAQPTGIAIMGDSGSAEYRADANKGGAYAATTFNWMELLAADRGLNFGPWTTKPFPRLTGYDYNWAASGATSASVLSDGQASGVASQVAAGLVGRAILMIGGDDLVPIVNGTVTTSAGVTALVNATVANIAQALDIVKAAGSVTLVVVNLPPIPPFEAATVRPLLASAINSLNAGIASVAAARGVLLVNRFAGEAMIWDVLDSGGNLSLNGQLITVPTFGDEPHHLYLADSHPGTVYNGLIADELIGALNLTGLTLAPFSDAELLAHAGIGTPPPDTTPPVVSLTAPASAATVSGSVTLSASATDNVGVVGVTFKADGVLIGSEDLTAPYAVTWVSTSVANGSHVLTASARDAAANVATTSVTVTVSNTAPPPPTTTLAPTVDSILAGTLHGGTVQNLASVDSQYLAVTSTSAGLSQTVVQFPTVTSPTRLDATVVLKSSQANTAIALFVYDFSHATWHQVATATIGTSAATVTASITSSLSSYVNGGQFGLMVQSQIAGSHIASIDQVQLVVTH